jgi:hypothetical protein
MANTTKYHKALLKLFNIEIPNKIRKRFGLAKRN